MTAKVVLAFYVAAIVLTQVLSELWSRRRMRKFKNELADIEANFKVNMKELNAEFEADAIELRRKYLPTLAVEPIKPRSKPS